MTKRLISTAALMAALSAGASAQTQTPAQVLRGLEPAQVVQSRIIGGDVTSLTNWPWQVALYITNGKDFAGFACGGSAIAPRWILTAAHCFSDPDPQHWRVVTKADRIEFDKFPAAARVLGVKQVIRHRGYKAETSENDIALLELAEPIADGFVQPLLAADASLEARQSVVVTGWGNQKWALPERDADGKIVRDEKGKVKRYFYGDTGETAKPEDFQSPDLRMAELPLVELAQCDQDYEKLAKAGKGRPVIDKRMLCAGLREGGRDACQGDSGGPLVAKDDKGNWRQIGVVSGGAGCALKEFPGYYTRVSTFAPWLRENVGKDLEAADGAPPPPAPQPQPQPEPVEDNAAGLAVAFDKGDEVTVGERVSYKVTTQKPGYLAVFDLTPDGKISQIYPNAASLRSVTGAVTASALVTPERGLLVPDYRNSYRGFDVIIEKPAGKGVIVAVLSPKPIGVLDLPAAPKAFASADEAAAKIGKLRDELARDLVVTGNRAGKPNWSVAKREYTIREK